MMLVSAADYLIMNNDNNIHQQHHDDSDSFRRRASAGSHSSPAQGAPSSSGCVVRDDNDKDDNNSRPTSPMETEMPMPIMNTSSNSNMPKKQSSILGASSNLVNSIVGAGIIGILPQPLSPLQSTEQEEVQEE